jgi:hypothetical protein
MQCRLLFNIAMAFSRLAAQEVGGGAGFAHGADSMQAANSGRGYCDGTATFVEKNVRAG